MVVYRSACLPLVRAWNERQAARMPILFSPTIAAAIASRHWFLWARCPACRCTCDVDLRGLDRHPDAAVKGSKRSRETMELSRKRLRNSEGKQPA